VSNKLKLFTMSFGHKKAVIGLSLTQGATIVALNKQDITDL